MRSKLTIIQRINEAKRLVENSGRKVLSIGMSAEHELRLKRETGVDGVERITEFQGLPVKRDNFLTIRVKI